MWEFLRGTQFIFITEEVGDFFLAENILRLRPLLLLVKVVWRESKGDMKWEAWCYSSTTWKYVSTGSVAVRSGRPVPMPIIETLLISHCADWATPTQLLSQLSTSEVCTPYARDIFIEPAQINVRHCGLYSPCAVRCRTDVLGASPFISSAQ